MLASIAYPPGCGVLREFGAIAFSFSAALSYPQHRQYNTDVNNMAVTKLRLVAGTGCPTSHFTADAQQAEFDSACAPLVYLGCGNDARYWMAGSVYPLPPPTAIATSELLPPPPLISQVSVRG